MTRTATYSRRTSLSLAAPYEREHAASLAAMAMAAFATVLMLQATRVFVAYLIFIIDQSQRVTIGGIAGGTFLAIALGGLLAHVAGRRVAVLAATVVLVVTRLTLQLWDMPEARLALGAVAIAAWGWRSRSWRHTGRPPRSGWRSGWRSTWRSGSRRARLTCRGYRGWRRMR